MARVDLNAKRAARSEAENEPHELVLGHLPDGTDQVFLLRPRMPLEFSALLRRGESDEAIKLILVNPDDWARLRREIPDDDDLYDIGRLYDLDLGESPASTATSPDGGTSSRPPSSEPTPLTSAPSVSDRKRSVSGGSSS